MTAFEGYDQLSTKEKFAFSMLKEVNSDSIWGLAIKNVVTKPDLPRLRRLISDLKGQNDDNPAVMQQILGDAYHPVINC